MSGLLVVMFPDHMGKWFKGEFGQALTRMKATFSDRNVVLVPVLNGLPADEFGELANEATRLGFTPVVSPKSGLMASLFTGYKEVVRRYPAATVVRLDTAEHPLSYIHILTEAAERRGGMAIGDLEFGPDNLRGGSLDELAHMDIWPTLYGQFTHGYLSFSCAHGFQAFAPMVCAHVLERASAIVDEVENELNQSISWGFDSAMALAAHALGVPLEIVKVPAERVRDRSREKIAAQFSAALRICRAAAKLG